MSRKKEILKLIKSHVDCSIYEDYTDYKKFVDAIDDYITEQLNKKTDYMMFNDLIFREKPSGGIIATNTFKNGLTISVVAGEYAYSTPRSSGDNPDVFSSFEIAILNDRGDFVTKNIFPDEIDDVIGWKSREEINDIIKVIEQI
jgi:hypothetical protein